MRRDAEQRRDALLRAAEDCFREFGYQVPFETIARRAGVGRGTLYRNFKDRLALIVAIYHRHLDRVETQVAGMADIEQVLAAIVLAAGPMESLYSRLALDLMKDEDAFERFSGIDVRVNAFLEPIVARAQAAGMLRRDAGLDAMKLCVRMAGSIIKPSYTDTEASAVARQALALLMDGLRPR